MTISWFFSLLIVQVCSQSNNTFRQYAYRGGDAPVLGNPNPTYYNYVPAVVLDGGTRTFWCSNNAHGKIPGDHIWYARGESVDGAYGAKSIVFGPTGKASDFDGEHTCDPAVVATEGTYYLYYGGCCGTSVYRTAVGVAASTDGGHTFHRLNGGKPIIESASQPSANKYGAGQPSVIYKHPYFYMVYTDTASRAGGGNRLFVTRSKDPTFQAREEWVEGKFISYNSSTTTRSMFQGGASSDWVYSDVWDAFVLAVDGTTATASTLTVWDGKLAGTVATLELPGSWTEGTGLVHKLDGHVPPTARVDSAKDGSMLASVPIDNLRSVGTQGKPFEWQLAHAGEDWVWGARANASAVDPGLLYDGCLIESAGLPLALVIGGVRLQWAVRAAARHVSQTTFKVSREVFNRIPYGAGVNRGAKVLGAPRRPAGLLLGDGQLWPLGCLALVVDNNSTITRVSDAEYDKYKRGPALHCLHP